MAERDRRFIRRTRLKVIHRHRIGSRTFRRVSELVFVRGRPRALLEWVNLGGVRSPLYMAELDPAKLRKARNPVNTYVYDGLTVDPRFEDAADAASA
jgi:hypothetical protein